MKRDLQPQTVGAFSEIGAIEVVELALRSLSSMELEA